MKHFLLLLPLLFALPAQAQMRHYVPGEAPKKAEAPAPEQKPEAAAEDEDAPQDYGGGSFTVTPVNDCFKQLRPGEADELRRDFANPYVECQKRLKDRAEEKAREEKKGAKKDKDQGKTEEKEKDKK
jgi:hypothetical protein